jgi:hypothetical protein
MTGTFYAIYISLISNKIGVRKTQDKRPVRKTYIKI